MLLQGTTRSLYAPVGLLPITDLTRSNTPAFGIFSHRPSVCQRLFQPTKPYAATSTYAVGRPPHHSWTCGDQATHATTGWSTSVRTPAFLNQLIYGAGLSSVDMERRYGPGWLCDDDDDDAVTSNSNQAYDKRDWRLLTADGGVDRCSVLRFLCAMSSA